MMEIKTKKDLLCEYGDLQCAADALEDAIPMVARSADRILALMPGQTLAEGSPFAAMMAIVGTCIQDCNALSLALQQCCSSIKIAIKGIPDRSCREVLWLHYIRGQRFSAIANSVNYSERRIFQLYKKGLEMLDLQLYEKI